MFDEPQESGGKDYIARIWDVATGHNLARFDSLCGSVNCLASSPDSARLAATSTSSGRIWDISVLTRADTATLAELASTRVLAGASALTPGDVAQAGLSAARIGEDSRGRASAAQKNKAYT